MKKKTVINKKKKIVAVTALELFKIIISEGGNLKKISPELYHEIKNSFPKIMGYMLSNAKVERAAERASIKALKMLAKRGSK